MAKPEGIVLVTSQGLRIPVDLRYVTDLAGIRYWQPVIEGDLGRILPDVVAIDGPRLHPGEALHFPWDTREWAERVVRNSQNTLSYYTFRDEPEAHHE